VSGPTVLLIEDDVPTRRAVAKSLLAHGYRVAEAGDGSAAALAWEGRRPDLVVLDLGLPDTDGMTVLRRIRNDAATPVLILTARDAEHAKVEALDLGADDYVTKPFGLDELHARVRALLRRAGGPAAAADGAIVLGPLVVDVTRHTVEVDATPVRLTPREFEVLRVLVLHAGRLVTHGRLLRAVWGRQYDEEAHYLHVYVSAIRRKLAAADRTGALEGLIVSEPGVGYRVSAIDRPAGSQPEP
jgi:two-component system, OmpR family, KDP operon response regulator KdpE